MKKLLLLSLFIPIALLADNVSLIWDPSPDENVAGYRIYYGVASRTYTNVVDVGYVTNTIITNLTINVTYYFAATAYNILGMESDYSDEATYSSQYPVPPTGLIGYWKFDAGTGSSAADFSGNGQTGTLVNGVNWVIGHTGSAVNMDGIDDHVSVPNLDVTGSGITLAAWVNLASLSTSSDVRFISKASDSSEGGHWWMLGHSYNGNHRLRFRLKTGGVTTTLIASTGDLLANTWLHVAATYDGVTMRLYLNGDEVGGVPKTGSIDVNSTVKVNFGRNPEGSNYFSGWLDEARIYERSLSPTEIRQIMNDTVVTPPPSAPINLKQLQF